MKRTLLSIVFTALLVLVLAGCNLPGAAGPNNAQLEQTYVALTISAGLTQNAPSGGDQQPGDQQPGDQQPGDQQPDTPTDTPPPTNTPIPTNTPQPTPTSTKSIPCNRAGWVKDVTVPDGTTFAPGTSFTKTWRLENTGSCNWNGDYELVFDSGDKMNGGSVVDLAIGTIKPGEIVDISVDLKAPNTPGEYKGEWLLRSDDNVVFGLGDNDVPVFVEIEVVDPVSFTVISTSNYMCGGDKYVSMRLKNTGTEELESSAIGVKNLDTNTIVGIFFAYNNNPFTENKNDCPPMSIDNMEPGDVYYLTYNMGNASANFEFSIELCSGEDGGGDCVVVKATHKLP